MDDAAIRKQAGASWQMLSVPAQALYLQAFRMAWQQYPCDARHRHDHSTQAGTAHKAAWLAVEKACVQDEDGCWCPPPP